MGLELGKPAVLLGSRTLDGPRHLPGGALQEARSPLGSRGMSLSLPLLPKPALSPGARFCSVVLDIVMLIHYVTLGQRCLCGDFDNRHHTKLL